MTWRKVFVLDATIDWGFHTVVSDIDVVWLHDPVPTLFNLSKHADMIFSQDGVESLNKEGDAGLEEGGSPWRNWNTGTPDMSALLSRLLNDVHGCFTLAPSHTAVVFLCAGVYLVINNDRSRTFVHVWRAAFETEKKGTNDQVCCPPFPPTTPKQYTMHT